MRLGAADQPAARGKDQTGAPPIRPSEVAPPRGSLRGGTAADYAGPMKIP